MACRGSTSACRQLGRGGVEQVIEIKLTPEEQEAFDKSVGAVRELVDSSSSNGGDHGRKEGQGAPAGAGQAAGRHARSTGAAGYHTVTPYLTVDDGARAIEFYARAFGAREKERMPGPGGKIMHAELRVGDSVVMLSDEFPA